MIEGHKFHEGLYLSIDIGPFDTWQDAIEYIKKNEPEYEEIRQGYYKHQKAPWNIIELWEFK